MCILRFVLLPETHGMKCAPIGRLLATLAVTLLACGAAHAGELLVSAASSLSNAFTDVAARYEAAHPGTKVLLNFGASGALLQQIDKGAAVDVFASADQETMDLAEERTLVATPDRHTFVRNTLVVVRPRNSEPAIARIADLQQPGGCRW
ncbi:MAG: hypothetical protein CALGDGBN_02736 [Pseudomonadales bacterium]|nr:hypothetical protein [Pseudomonadales bacterium]